MEKCQHRWVRVHEQSLVGGTFPVGWSCEVCQTMVPDARLTPEGLPGVVTGKHRLVGPHGGEVVRANGSRCRSQTYDAKTGELSYEY